MATTPDPSSDLPYVRGDGQNVRANPVFEVGMVNWSDRSGRVQAADTSFVLFDAKQAPDFTISNRILGHVGGADSGSLWVTWIDGVVPAANKPGCFEWMPGDVLPIPSRAEVRAIGTQANLPFTALEG